MRVQVSVSGSMRSLEPTGPRGGFTAITDIKKYLLSFDRRPLKGLAETSPSGGGAAAGASHYKPHVLTWHHNHFPCRGSEENEC